MKTLVDFFCGSGGTSCGFSKAGYKPICAVDLDCNALRTYAANFPNAEVICKDIKSPKLQEYLIEKYQNVDCIICCCPCQNYSNRNLTTEITEDDAKNKLPFISARLIVKMKPKTIFMEEVQKCIEIAPKLTDIFEKAGYTVSYGTHFASDYGVPQKRKRFILVATRNGIADFVYPKEMSEISAGCALKQSPIPKKGNEVSEQTRRKIIDLQKKGIRMIGGNYSLMDLNKPSPTIHTQTLSATGPYTIKRGNKYHSLSVEEAARLQSYPATYKFRGTETSIRRQIGNSVPPLFAFAIAKGIEFYQRVTRSPRSRR